MSSALQFKPHLRCVSAGDERVFLLGERDTFILQGQLYGLVAPSLPGRTEAELIAALEGRASPEEVLYVVELLREKGYLAGSGPGLSPEVAAYWQSLGLDPATAEARLQATPVAVEAFHGLDPAAATEALLGAGVRVDAEADLRLLLVQDYLCPELKAWNHSALAEKSGRAFPVKPTGTVLWMGPLLAPGAGPCWECLAQRLRWNRPVETFLQRRSSAPDLSFPPRGQLATSARAGLDLAALRLARWIAAGGLPEDRLTTVDLAGFRIEEHPVLRRPQCPACGDPDLLRRRAGQPPVLVSRPLKPGADRMSTPEAIDSLHTPRHLGRVTGIVSSLGPMPGSDALGQSLWGAVVPSLPVAAGAVPGKFEKGAWGRGSTAVEARVGALCEALEHYSLMFHGDEPRLRARIGDLGAEAVSPAELLQFSPAQYRDRKERNARCQNPQHLVPVPFDPGVEIDWTPVWSLGSGRRRYLPTAACYANLPVRQGAHFISAESNGCAAGSCLEEAIVHGFTELVERDAVSLWWFNRLRRPAVDLASFENPYFDQLRGHYAALGCGLWVLDLTTDLGIPAFTAVAHSPASGRFSFGFGSHLDAASAVRRALTELNQLFSPDRPMPESWPAGSPEALCYLFPDESVPVRKAEDLPSLASGDLRQDTLTCVDRAARVGLETLVLDLTQPDLGLTVARVCVPGLRHFWPRFGPGRLYDVPVRLGWLPAPLHEDQLNPLPPLW